VSGGNKPVVSGAHSTTVLGDRCRAASEGRNNQECYFLKSHGETLLTGQREPKRCFRPGRPTGSYCRTATTARYQHELESRPSTLQRRGNNRSRCPGGASAFSAQLACRHSFQLSAMDGCRQANPLLRIAMLTSAAYTDPAKRELLIALTVHLNTQAGKALIW
jgi:hypothetical protein